MTLVNAIARYHYMHSGDHGDRGMVMLTDGTHPPFLDRTGQPRQENGRQRRYSTAAKDDEVSSDEVCGPCSG